MTIDIFLWFVSLVVKMRQHQSAWFRLHKQSDLYEAKRFEKQVDEWIAAHVHFENGEPVRFVAAVQLHTDEPTQGNLFTQENGNEA